MDNLQQLLQVSAKLYQHVTNLPKDEERDAFIDKIHSLLEDREQLIANIQQQAFEFDGQNSTHKMLAELDKGIRAGLDKVMNAIKDDLKELQNTKKNERQYLQPYSSVEVMDGRYYDKKN